MEKNIFINELQIGSTIEDFFLLSSAQKATAKNGPYWKLVLQDASGLIDGVIWSPLSESFPTIPTGVFVNIRAVVGAWGEKKQLRIEMLTILPAENHELNFTDFLPSSEVPPEQLMEAVEDLITEYIEYQPLKKLLRNILKNKTIRPKLLQATGAKTVHHAYAGGLLEHTLAVCQTCLAQCTIHPELDRQILLAAAILHDLGKAWELSGDIENTQTDEGRLLGHILLGLEKIEPFLSQAKMEPEITLHLKHLIASHHGEYEFGTLVLPMTPEAFVLHHADNIDAKLNIMQGIYQEMENQENNWSAYNRYLERAIHRRTIVPCKKSENSKNLPENQCLLPLKE